MPLELLRECLKLIDFKSERSRLSGEFRIGVEDDVMNDLNGDDSARWRAALDEFRPYSGDQATTNVFPVVQAMVFEGQHRLRCYLGESRQYSLMASILFGVLALLPYPEFLDFFKLDFQKLYQIEEHFYLCIHGAYSCFGESADEDLETIGDSKWNLSQVSIFLTCQECESSYC